MRIYLAGPMRGYPEFNHPAFIRAAIQLRRDGHEVFSPAEHNLQLGLDPAGMSGDQAEVEHKFPLRRCVGDNLAWICAEAEAVVLLDGWTRSSGARAEVATALALGLPVWELAPAPVMGSHITSIPCLACETAGK